MVPIRPATDSDIADLCALDPVAHWEDERRELIRHALRSGSCIVAETPAGRIAGYGVFGYSFFRHGFVELLYVDPEFRRQGIGSALLQHMEKQCRTHKIFASTNESNGPMQALLNRERFVESGVIHNLDDGDPEIVFFKQLRAR